MQFLRTYSATKKACYLGYITQAVTINFSPLLFVRFGQELGISLTQISLLIGINFTIQLLIDLSSAKFLPHVNLRLISVLTQIFASAGLVGLAFLPWVFPSPFAGLVTSTLLCGMGGGLSEVLISPLIEACPSDNKASSMSFLHSFYCWGQAGLILLSVLFFRFFGIVHWRVLACLLAAEPILDALLFSVVPMPEMNEEGGGMPIRRLFGMRLFLCLFVMIAAAGAAEQVMSQWASSFAENGLGVDKATGDLLGPCLFALLMGISRIVAGLIAGKVSLFVTIPVSAVLCVISYLLAGLSGQPMLALAGCALCGFSVGVFWPGVYSLAAKSIPNGGMPMFSILALAGDVGCLLGPSVAGKIADANGGNLRVPFLVAIALPALLLIATVCLRILTERRSGEPPEAKESRN